MPAYDNSTTASSLVKTFPSRVKGKTFLVTGPSTGGLGAQTVLTLAAGHPVRLVLLGRSRSNAEGTIADVQCVSPETKVEWVDVNLDSIASVREAASKVEKALAAGDKIDGLVGNAAIMAVPYALTGDGIERHFQTNHLSHWLLVNLLLSKGLISDHDSRIVLVTSGIRPAQAPSVEDIRDWSFQGGRNYHPIDGYALSKFSNALTAKYLAHALGQKRAGISAFTVNPGSIKTNLQGNINPELVQAWDAKRKSEGKEMQLRSDQAVKSADQGIASAMRALLDPELKAQSGAYLDQSQVVPTPNLDYPAVEELAGELWKVSEGLVGEKFDV